ncbi:MAG: citryl-CoA lyase, partial [Candidatus Methylomirabilales bacterium]
IAYKTRDRIVVRGYDLNDLTGNLDLGEMAYLVWRGELPSESHAKMLNAIMVCLAEHAFSPSSAAARLVASGGVPLHAAVSGGMLTIGELHGTFDRPAAMFQNGVVRARAEGKNLEEIAEVLVEEAREKKQRLPGFHHPQHIRDPRSERLVQVGQKLGVAGDHLSLALAMEDATERHHRKRIWLNAVGVSGALLSDMGFEPELSKGVMLVSRCISLVAHVYEEMTREKGWRASSGQTITQPLDLELQRPDFYDGPKDRGFPPDHIKS